jgi:hypothetical protein
MRHGMGALSETTSPANAAKLDTTDALGARRQAL